MKINHLGMPPTLCRFVLLDSTSNTPLKGASVTVRFSRTIRGEVRDFENEAATDDDGLARLFVSTQNLLGMGVHVDHADYASVGRWWTVDSEHR